MDDACASDPCHVGAICDTSPIDGTYICSCPSGFKGVDCTQDVDECEEGMNIIKWYHTHPYNLNKFFII